MKLGMVMDPIAGINIKKDSSFAMLLAAQKRDWPLYYMEAGDLFQCDATPMARMHRLEVSDDPSDWYRFTETIEQPLTELDAILMRKDPPFDVQYLLASFMLEHAERAGTLVVNRPRGLRDANEKLFTTRFPECIPPTLLTSEPMRIRDFLAEHGDIIVKPPDRMGGESVFRLREDDPNIGVILETVTARGRHQAIAQRYIPEITSGDKRILMIDGEPVSYALARVPITGESRANLAAGGRGEGVPLSDRDRWICGQVGPVLREHGLWFAGLDVIGDYLTEINVTSPTCIRELDALFDLDIAGQLLDCMLHLRDAG